MLNWDQEANSALIVLDPKTGKTSWKKDRDDKTSWNTPLVVDTQRHKRRSSSTAPSAIRSYDLANGTELLWQCGGMTVNAIPSPSPPTALRIA